MSNRYLFLYTVGPVHSFIEQARKAKDLYAGSHMLTELTKAGIRTVKTARDAKIIFPQTEQDSKNDSYPNRFLAEVTCDDVVQLGETVEKAVKDRFAKMLPKKLQKSPRYEAYEKQLKDHLQSYWAAIPYDGTHYQETYRQLERNMGKIKNIRAFKQLDETDGREKCELCGVRNAINLEGKRKKGEGKLCSLCYSKRHIVDQMEKKQYDKIFPTTAAVAMAYWLRDLKETPEGMQLYTAYQDLFPRQFSEQFLFEENIGDYYKDTYTKDERKAAQQDKNQNEKQMIAKLGEIQRFMKKHYPESRRRKYYALVAFDGDSMGKWLAGTFYKQGIDFREVQEKLSLSLGKFAQWVRSHLKTDADETKGELLGSVVYAGGEDFMGFIPVNHLFHVLKTLRSKFTEMVTNEISAYTDGKHALTFSAGVCVAHYKSPLVYTTETAKQMESKGKGFRDQKDALAISVMKRSGEINTTVFSWKNENQDFLIDALETIKEKFHDNVFSDAFVRNIAYEIREFDDGKTDMRDTEDLILSESDRLIARAFNRDGGFDGKEIQAMQQTVRTLYKAFADQESNEPSQSLENFATALLMAEFLGREQEL